MFGQRTFDDDRPFCSEHGETCTLLARVDERTAHMEESLARIEKRLDSTRLKVAQILGASGVLAVVAGAITSLAMKLLTGG